MENSPFSVILISILASSFFSGMEIAFVSANKLKIELGNRSGGFTARMYSRFMEVPTRFITTMLLGNNIALVIYGIAMGVVLSDMLNPYISSQVLMLLTQTLISTGIILLFAEFLPKAMFSVNPNGALHLFALPVFFFYYTLYPVVWGVNKLSNVFLKYILRVKPGNKRIHFGMVDLDHLLKEATSGADDEEEIENEVQIFRNALDFSGVKVRECMVPRTEVVAFEVEDDPDDLLKSFIETGISKIIIYRDSIDNVIGYVHSSEMFKKPDHIKKVLLPISVVPETMPANELMELLTSKNRSVAIVLDEFGGTSGLVTIEDVVEELFGEIEDEHDQEYLEEQVIDDNKYRFSARLEVDYLNNTYKLSIPESENYETLAGYILYHLESIPEEGETIDIDDFRIKILKNDDMRIDLVELYIPG